MKNISIIMGFLFVTSSVQAMQHEYDEFDLLPEFMPILSEVQNQGNDATELLSDVILHVEPRGIALDEDVKKTYEANPRQCPECAYGGRVPCDIKKHAACRHNRCLECEDCKKFDDRAAIIKHYELNHPNARFAKEVSRRVCEYCNQNVFSRVYNAHMRDMHFRNDNAGYEAFLKDKRDREESGATQTTTTSTESSEVLAQVGNTLVSQTIAWLHTAQGLQQNDFTARQETLNFTVNAELEGVPLGENAKKAYEANPRQCPECVYGGKAPCDIKKHAACRHNRCLECADCKKFDDRAAIIKHYELNHPNARFAKEVSRRVCEYCSQNVFSRIYNAHIRNMHFRNDNAGYEEFLKNKRGRIEESGATQTTTTSTESSEVLAQTGNALANQPIAWLHTAQGLQQNDFTACQKALDELREEPLDMYGQVALPAESFACSPESIQTENIGQSDDAYDVAVNVELEEIALDEDIKRAYEANPKQCPECEYNKKASSDIRKHAARIHNRCLECKDCKRFDDRAAIIKHYELNHPNARFAKAVSSRVCEYCNQNILCRSYDIHLRKMHPDIVKDTRKRKRERTEESGVTQTTTTSTYTSEVLAQVESIIARLDKASQSTVLQESAINHPEKSVNALQELRQNDFTAYQSHLGRLSKEFFGVDWTLE